MPFDQATRTRAALLLMKFHGPSEAFSGLPAYRFVGPQHVRAVEAGGFVTRLVSGNSAVDWTYHAVPTSWCGR